MVKFDLSSFRFIAKEDYQNEVKTSKSIQDEVKKYNERFPEWLEPLHKLDERINASDSITVGEFSEGMMAGDTDKEKIWSFFMGKNFNKKAIAGIIGNIGQETGGTYNPKTVQGGGKGPGTGLIQWGDNADGGRWNQLEDWAAKEGKDKWTTETQMEWLWIEMNQQYHLNLFSRNLKKFNYSTGSDTLEAFGKVDDIEDAMMIFELTIERAGVKHYPRRLKYAQKAYDELKDWSPSMSTSNGVFVEPYKTKYRETSQFGYRIHPIHKTRRLHAGIDLAAGIGTPIYPVANGKVVVNKYGSSSGYNVVVDHGVVKGNQVFSSYMHMNKKSSLKVGQTVTINTQIGEEGTTGDSTGSHLHLEIMELPAGSSYSYRNHVDPKNYIVFTGKGR